MGMSKTEINLRRLLIAAPQQQNQAKLLHLQIKKSEFHQISSLQLLGNLRYLRVKILREKKMNKACNLENLLQYVATAREQLAQLTGEGTQGLPSISASKAKEYAEKIEALAARIDSKPLSDESESLKMSDGGQFEEVPKLEDKSTVGEGSFASTSSTPVLRKRHIYNGKERNKSREGTAAQSSSPIKLDASAQMHIEKHRKLQDDLTDELVGLARQLKETSLTMNQSLVETEKVLDSTERAVEHSLASTNRANERAGEIFSESFKTSCLTWVMIFIMSCMFLLVVLLIRIT